MSEREPRKIYKCTLAGYATFYVVARDETAARKAIEKQWQEWDYISGRGRVVGIEALAEEGQYPELPTYQVTGPDTYLLVLP